MRLNLAVRVGTAGNTQFALRVRDEEDIGLHGIILGLGDCRFGQRVGGIHSGIRARSSIRIELRIEPLRGAYYATQVRIEEGVLRRILRIGRFRVRAQTEAYTLEIIEGINLDRAEVDLRTTAINSLQRNLRSSRKGDLLGDDEGRLYIVRLTGQLGLKATDYEALDRSHILTLHNHRLGQIATLLGYQLTKDGLGRTLRRRIQTHTSHQLQALGGRTPLGRHIGRSHHRIGRLDRRGELQRHLRSRLFQDDQLVATPLEVRQEVDKLTREFELVTDYGIDTLTLLVGVKLRSLHLEGSLGRHVNRVRAAPDSRDGYLALTGCIATCRNDEAHRTILRTRNHRRKLIRAHRLVAETNLRELLQVATLDLDRRTYRTLCRAVTRHNGIGYRHRDVIFIGEDRLLALHHQQILPIGRIALCQLQCRHLKLQFRDRLLDDFALHTAQQYGRHLIEVEALGRYDRTDEGLGCTTLARATRSIGDEFLRRNIDCCRMAFGVGAVVRAARSECTDRNNREEGKHILN